jgi:hypothetical protein
MKREQIKKQRLENPQKRDKYLKDMREYSESLSRGLRESGMRCTCEEEGRFDKEEYTPCDYCSMGQQSAELYDESIGIEGIDY